jgi:hypothetical protein
MRRRVTTRLFDWIRKGHLDEVEPECVLKRLSERMGNLSELTLDVGGQSRMSVREQ